MERYEAFRRSHFDKNKVKKLIQRVAGVDTVSNEMAVALGGIAKIFAGELIELARQDMNDFKGAIHPLHIRNAYRKLRQAGKIPYLPAPPHGLID
ncbi:Transcription initiation factor TFIID subunit 11 [Hondaea fermentalgiana]|uniref:Transcription initiation factor TFIID subunit 11 n=1 Tax=Hondaea fermentalgiana TaxID=2315210 RepID=A0A2R5GDN0_9STRA|nr:Transcription initiation factor TFIID subunit 11 [Hondaea fermentalgiana]|eukprot:GBG26301.1 Transcription initiation factor TFIID subunit 11 [Hondaea fermentalgiana]